MIREIKNYKIQKTHPRFFWTKCYICERQFKKEDMWKITYNINGLIHNICMHCAETIGIAEHYAKTKTEMLVPLYNIKKRIILETLRIILKNKNQNHLRIGQYMLKGSYDIK